MKRFGLLFFLLISIIQVSAQIDTSKIKSFLRFFDLKSNDYVEVVSKSLYMKMYYASPGMSVKIFNLQKEHFDYLPSIRDQVGLDVGLKGLSMAASLQFPSKPSLTEKYGSTQSTNLSVNFTMRSFGIYSYYIKYKGFYQPDPVWIHNDLNYIRPDISVSTFGLSTYLVTSPNFSASAVMTQSEKQLKSAGTFLIQLSTRMMVLNSDSSFIPIERKAYFPEFYKVEKSFLNNYSLKPGGAYTYVYKDFFISGIACVGPSFSFSAVKFNDRKRKSFGIKPSMNTTLKFAVGYQNDLVFGNIIYEFDALSYPRKDFVVKTNFHQFKIGLGIRF